MNPIFIDQQKYEQLLAALMKAAHDALGLNDPNPFLIALAEVAEIYPDTAAAYWEPHDEPALSKAA